MNMPLNIDWQQILLHLLNFVILFAILYFLLYEPVKKFMDNRTRYYEKIDAEAKVKLADSEKAKEEYMEKMKAVGAEIDEERNRAHKAISEETEKRMLLAKQEAEKIISDAHERAEKERNKILEEAQREVADIVTAAAEKLLLQSSTSESYEQFLTAVERGGEDDE